MESGGSESWYQRKTQIAGFEFDNCLMNAAGVACMTIEELEGVKNSAAGPLSLRQRPWTSVKEILSHAIKMSTWFHQLYGLPNNGLDYYLDYLLDLQEKEPSRTFFLSLVGMSPEETHTILKKVQESDFRGLTELKPFLSKCSR